MSDYQHSDKEIVISVLDKLIHPGILSRPINRDIKLTEVVKAVNEIRNDRLKVIKVEEILKSLGFKVTYTHGIKYVRTNSELLNLLVRRMRGKSESNTSWIYHVSAQILPEAVVPVSS